MDAEELAKKFHETYERLAPEFGYKTKKDSAVVWVNVPEKNKKLMIAVCRKILQEAEAQNKDFRELLKEWWENNDDPILERKSRELLNEGKPTGG